MISSVNSDPRLRAKLRVEIELELRRRQRGVAMSRWTRDGGEYVNSERGRRYTPHHQAEVEFVTNDEPRWWLAKGGEGGGKSVAGIIKGLERLRRGMSGAMGSPDFEHFKKSLWPEFRRWCPWESVVESQRYRQSPSWEPSRPFTLTFRTPEGRTVQVMCGGFDDPLSWEGPNLHWFHFDEGRRHKTPHMLKVADGRIRLVGPRGEPPQGWITTTPAKHWLYEYFGPWEKEGDDPHAQFKLRARVVDLLTIDNERAGNLEAGYTNARGSTLTEAERRVLLEAAWEDIDRADPFIPHMSLWDACYDPSIGPLDRRTPVVMALDAGVTSDCFACVMVGKHPTDRNRYAERYVRIWEPTNNQALDYGPIEAALLQLMRDHNIIHIAYDQYQLHQMAGNLRAAGAWVEQFSQGQDRLVADKALLDVIVSRSFAHRGDAVLTRHIKNAGRELHDQRLRIVKITSGQKIDAAVALSMALHRAQSLNLY